MFDPDVTSYNWLLSPDRLLEQPHIMECTLAAGEVLYIPAQWWHSTLNIGETVFLSTFL